MIRRGFTLIELLIFAAIFTVIMAGFITVLIAVVRVQSRQTSSNEVETQGQFLLQQFQYYIQTARIVSMPADTAAGTLQLRMASSSQDPTLITLATGTVYLQQGMGGVLTALTSNKVTVSNLSFTRHYNYSSTSAPYGMDSVSYSFTMAANTSNATQQYTQTFQSSAALLIPVPNIVLIQQTSTVTAGGTSTVLAATFPGTNATGSLLIAAVANTNVVTVSVSGAVDSAGNTWTQVASTSYAAYGKELTLFAALNAKNSTNTVTINFSGTGAFSPTLFLYEYRGASTSTSFDAKSAATSSASTTLTSGFANPTSTVELLFGLLSLTAAPTSPPVAGIGFSIESSSSASNAYVEDQDLFVTGPVAAPWTISPAATGTAIVVTFK